MKRRPVAHRGAAGAGGRLAAAGGVAPAAASATGLRHAQLLGQLERQGRPAAAAAAAARCAAHLQQAASSCKTVSVCCLTAALYECSLGRLRSRLLSADHLNRSQARKNTAGHRASVRVLDKIKCTQANE